MKNIMSGPVCVKRVQQAFSLCCIVQQEIELSLASLQPVFYCLEGMGGGGGGDLTNMLGGEVMHLRNS